MRKEEGGEGEGPTWNPVSLTPVSSEVVSLAVFSILALFSSVTVWTSYKTVPSLISRMQGWVNACERLVITMC